VNEKPKGDSKMKPEYKTIPMFEGATVSSAGTLFGCVDTKGFSHLGIDLAAGTGEAAQTACTILRLCENDASAMTAYTDGTPITQFVGAAAVSTSAGFVLPALSSTKQNVYRFNIDLRGRKRYIGINLGLAKQTVGVSAHANLFRSEIGPAMVTAATGADGARLIVSG
jgi:hypothetical protein